MVSMAISAIGMAMPGPEDWIIGSYQALLTAYSVNLEWDVEWASNWYLPDDLHSHSDDTWVMAAILSGIYDSYYIEIPFTDIGFNPLDFFVDDDAAAAPTPAAAPTATPYTAAAAAAAAAGPVTPGFAFGVGGKRYASFSHRRVVKNALGHDINVRVFTHPKGGRNIVLWPESAKKAKTTVQPHGFVGMSPAEAKAARKKDIEAANVQHARDLGYPNPESYKDYDWQAEYGEPMTWHHGIRYGQMELVSYEAHLRVGHQGGNNLWYSLNLSG